MRWPTSARDVTNLGAAAAKARAELGIVDPDPETMSSNTADIDIGPVRAIEAQVDDARLKTAEFQTELAQVEKLKPEELMVALHMLNIDDPTVMKILPLFQDSVSEEARLLNSGLGPNHPKIKSLRATKQVYTQQLDEQITAIRASLAPSWSWPKARRRRWKTGWTKRAALYTERKNQGSDYTDAKYKYLEAKHLLEAAEQRLSTEQMQFYITPVTAKVWEYAEPALAPGKPKVGLYTLLAAVVGMILGVGLAFFLEYLDTSVKSLEDVERFLGVPVLAVIPKNVGILMHQKGDSADAEAYRILRTNIEFNRKNPDANTLTIVSGGPGEGKSTTLFNLAYTCAKGGLQRAGGGCGRAAPFAAPALRRGEHRGPEQLPHEQHVLRGSGALDRRGEPLLHPERPVAARFHGHPELPAHDRSHPPDQAASTTWCCSIRPPILSVSDGAVLASEVDMAIMVIEHRRFPRSMLQRVRQAIVNVGGNLLGVVLNKVDNRHDAGYTYYGGVLRRLKRPTPPTRPGRSSRPTATAGREPAEARAPGARRTILIP